EDDEHRDDAEADAAEVGAHRDERPPPWALGTCRAIASFSAPVSPVQSAGQSWLSTGTNSNAGSARAIASIWPSAKRSSAPRTPTKRRTARWLSFSTRSVSIDRIGASPEPLATMRIGRCESRTRSWPSSRPSTQAAGRSPDLATDRARSGIHLRVWPAWPRIGPQDQIRGPHAHPTRPGPGDRPGIRGSTPWHVACGPSLEPGGDRRVAAASDNGPRVETVVGFDFVNDVDSEVSALAGLDVATVVEVAQALSAELAFEAVAERLLALAIERSGAGHGGIFLARAGEL